MISEHCRHPLPAVPGLHPRLRRLVSLEWIRIVGVWMERSRQRHALAQLDDRALKDIGVTRAQATREAAKPFWRK